MDDTPGGRVSPTIMERNNAASVTDRKGATLRGDTPLPTIMWLEWHWAKPQDAVICLTQALLHVTESLVFMHSRGIAHGDVSMENIIVRGDTMRAAQLEAWGCMTQQCNVTEQDFERACFTDCTGIFYTLIKYIWPNMVARDGCKKLTEDIADGRQNCDGDIETTVATSCMVWAGWMQAFDHR